MIFGLKYLIYSEISKPSFWWPYFADDTVTLRTLDLYLETLIEDYSNARAVKTSPESFIQRLVDVVYLDFERSPQIKMRLKEWERYRWSSGEEVSVEDIVFTLNDVLKSGKIATVFTYLADTVKKFYTSGDEIKADFYFPSKYMLSALEFYVLPNVFDSAEDYLEMKYAGIESLRDYCSGPFMPFYEEENRVYFRANEYYPKPLDIEYVVMDVNSDMKTVIGKFTSRGLDMIMPMENVEISSSIESLRKNPSVLVVDSLENRFYYVAFNYDNPFFTSPRVRRLMMEAIDRREILQNVFFNRGTIITGPFLPDFPGVDAEIQPIPYNPEEARELESYAGRYRSVVDGGNSLVLIFPAEDTNMMKLASLLVKFWKNAGLNVKMQGISISEYGEALKEGKFDLAIVEYSAMRSFSAVKPLLAPDGSQNYGRYNRRENGTYDPTLNEYLEWVEGPSAFMIDDARRIEIYKTIHRYVHENVVHLWLFTLQRSAFVWKDVVSIPFLVPERPFKNVDMWKILGDRRNRDIEEKAGW